MCFWTCSCFFMSSSKKSQGSGWEIAEMWIQLFREISGLWIPLGNQRDVDISSPEIAGMCI